MVESQMCQVLSIDHMCMPSMKHLGSIVLHVITSYKILFDAGVINWPDFLLCPIIYMYYIP